MLTVLQEISAYLAVMVLTKLQISLLKLETWMGNRKKLFQVASLNFLVATDPLEGRFTLELVMDQEDLAVELKLKQESHLHLPDLLH